VNGSSDDQSFLQGISIVQKISNHEIEFFDDVSFEEYITNYLGSGQENEILNEFGVSDFITLNETFTFQPALRLSNEGGGVLPSFGLIGQFGFWKIFANYSEGFAPPSISQKYSQTAFFVGNPTLSPEHSIEIDLGVERNLDQLLATRFEVFNRNIYNMFSYAYNNGVQTPINIGHGHALGAELSAETTGSLNGGVNLSYLNNVEVETNSPIPLSPRVQASIHVTKNFEGFSIKIQDTYWSDYYDQQQISPYGLVDLNSWNTFDVYLSRRLINEINLRLAALNLFDQERELTLSYPEPRRSFNIMIQGYL